MIILGTNEAATLATQLKAASPTSMLGATRNIRNAFVQIDPQHGDAAFLSFVGQLKDHDEGIATAAVRAKQQFAHGTSPQRRRT